MDIQTSTKAIVTELDRLRQPHCITTEEEGGVRYTRVKDTQAQEAWEMLTWERCPGILRPVFETWPCQNGYCLIDDRRNTDGVVRARLIKWYGDDIKTRNFWVLCLTCNGSGRISHDMREHGEGAKKGMLMGAILLLDIEEDVLRFAGRTWDRYDEQIEAVLWNINPEILAAAFLKTLKEETTTNDTD